MRFMYISLFLIINFINIGAKIRLLSFHYNRPDFVEFQYKAFKKFFNKDHELIVFNDASDLQIAQEIQQVCDKYGIQCVRFLQHWHEKSSLIDEIHKWKNITDVTGLIGYPELLGRHPSIRHCHVIQYALDNFGYDHDDILGLLDGDMFLIKKFDIREYLKHDDMIGYAIKDVTKTVEYIWPGIVFLNLKKLPNIKDLHFNVTCVDKHVTDSGGHSYFYLKSYPQIRLKKYNADSIFRLSKLKRDQLLKNGFNSKEIALIKNNPPAAELHINNHFLHYYRSSFFAETNPYASETKEFHKNKSNIFMEFLKSILS